MRKCLSSTLFLFLAIVLIAPFSKAARREPKIDSWRPIHYDVSLTFDDQLKTLSRAETRITLAILRSDVSTIDLDFGELAVDSVAVDNRPALFTHKPGVLEVRLPPAVKPETLLVLAVVYHGTPKDGLILTNDKDGHASAVGDNWPDRVHHWIPSFDHPSAKATVSFNITVPSQDLVVANGRLEGVRTTSPSTRTWTYEEQVPIPPYCMVIAAGQFSKLGPSSTAVTPLSYYVPPSEAANALKEFGPASQSLKFFNETIAPYPYEKLALIVGATQFGGMENSSAIVFPATVFHSGASAEISSRFRIRNSVVEVVAHEIAHQWFGDSVTESTWSDLWLSEGFATYFAGLFVQNTDGESAFRAYMQKAASTYFNYEKKRRSPIYDSETEDLFQLLNPNNYQKGAWVLHMLRSQLGDNAFFEGLRAYYAAHKRSTATSEDLRRELERTSGQDLQKFFASWVYGTGHPSYEWSWSWDEAKRVLRIHVLQLQPEAFFPNSLPMEITTRSGKSRVLFTPNEKNQNEEFALREIPTSIEFDPDATVLKDVKQGRSLSWVH